MSQFRNGPEGRVRIPDAVHYVVATDKFMSGWGLAKGKSRIIVPCSTDEKNAVLAYVRKRTDMRHVKVVPTPPKQRNGDVWSVLDSWIPLAMKGETK